MFKFYTAAAKPATGTTPTRDPYRSVVLLLFVFAIIGAVLAAVAGIRLANVMFLDLTATMGLVAGMLASVALAQILRSKPAEISMVASEPAADLKQPGLQKPDEPPNGANSAEPPAKLLERALRQRFEAVEWIRARLGDLGPLGIARDSTAATCLIVIVYELSLKQSLTFPSATVVAIASACCLAGAATAASAAHYFTAVDNARLAEAPMLCRGARVVAWILVLAAASIGLIWFRQLLAFEVAHLIAVVINLSVGYSLLAVKRVAGKSVETVPSRIPALTVLGSRNNIFGSVVDAAERNLGIDLRSTWALTVVRDSVEPLAIGLCLLAWLSTSLTVVGVEEQGLLERLGVPAAGEPLGPGLHAHLPWPIDTVTRIPVLRLQKISVGHEGEEAEGPEDVLWARQHAANEYTLLLGNGRDLITVDAAVQFRVADARAWYYHTQNPVDALRAIAYRAVMRSTVNRTLSDALSENVVTLTAHMRDMVQQDADALGLGVDVVSFTVGGMHPPVMVAASYERVVSAQIRKVAAVVNAQVYRNHSIPAAETFVLNNDKTVRADSASSMAKASGEAWSFRTMMGQYRASPQEYFFRRRLETLEKGLQSRHFTIVDARFLRDGGELWVVP